MLHNTWKDIKIGNEEFPDPKNEYQTFHQSQFIDPTERRRRILEKSEERMRKILGHSARVGDENTMPCQNRSQDTHYISKCNSGDSKIPNISSHCREGRNELHIWHVPFPVVIMLSVVLMKMVSVLETFEAITFSNTFSFMVPFLILECFYLVNKPIIRGVGAIDCSKFGFSITLGIFFHRIFTILEDMLLHFSIYFVSLCLIHTF